MKNLIPRLLIALLATSVAHSTLAKAAVVHVPGDATTIKAGIGLASAGDTVLVACGTYNENNIRMKSGIVLLSETGQADCVTIDAQQQNRVILCRGVTSTVIEGFTLTGGLAPAAAPGVGDGGGLQCIDNSSPSIINCVIANNEAPHNGGGVYSDNSTPLFTNCTITQNESGNGGDGMAFFGAFVSTSGPTLISCVITDNLGNGIWSVNSSPELIDCNIAGNTRGGIVCQANWPGVTFTLTDCTISGNSASIGGGLRAWACAATLTNCTLSDNSAGEGGALYVMAADVTLTDCLLTRNSASQRGGGMYLRTQNGTAGVSTSKTEFSNNTAIQEGARGFVEIGSVAVLTCSVDDLTGFAGNGMITLENGGCSTPVEATTWGRVKAMYR